jgi:hypothetical protein
MSVTDEHWLGLGPAQVKSPTLRLRSGQAFSQEREKWGTRLKIRNIAYVVGGVGGRGAQLCKGGKAGAASFVLKSKAPPFDFAQGRLSRKGREKWGTRPQCKDGSPA